MHSMLVSAQIKRLKNGTENLQLKRVTLVIKIVLPEGAYFFPLTLEAPVKKQLQMLSVFMFAVCIQVHFIFKIFTRLFSLNPDQTAAKGAV